MAAFLSDSFTDTSDTALESHSPGTGGTWTEHSSYSSGATAISNANRARNDASGTSVYYNDASPPSADYYVEAVMRAITLGSGANRRGGPIGRADPSANTMYVALMHHTNGEFNLNKIVSGTFTQIGTYSSAPSAGVDYTVRLEMNGTTIKVILDGTERISVTDSAISAAGKAGLFLAFGNNFGDTVGPHCDSITADSLGATNGQVTETASARIAVQSEVTESGSARISVASEAVETATARISSASEVVETLSARISLASEIVETISARIRVASEVLETATARISGASEVTKAASARIAIASLQGQVVETGSARIIVLGEAVETGTARIRVASEVSELASFRVVVHGEATEAASFRSSVASERTRTVSSRLSIAAEVTRAASAEITSNVEPTYVHSAPGVSRSHGSPTSSTTHVAPAESRTHKAA